MSKYASNPRIVLRLVSSLFLIMAVSACLDDGDKGPQGETGETGPPGETIIVNNDAESVAITIDSVTVQSAPVVEFTALDEDGMPFTGIASGAPRFTFVKLVPGTAGDPDRWQSYINNTESAGSVGPGTEDTIQATYDRGGELVNHNDGTYTYTFANDVTSVSSPIAVSWQPELVHRVTMELRGDFPVVNESYSFIPATGLTSGFNERLIVATESCNSCHNKLALHGGGRVDTKYCVTCHNPGTVDANSGNTVDFKVMIHKIHRSASLPSVQAGDDYVIYGYRDRAYDFSDIHFPQDIRNCSVCHDASDPATPQASNWMTKPSLEACGSCHDDVDFAAGITGGHAGGAVTDNSECTTCHESGRVAGGVDESHQIPGKLAAANFKYNIINVVDTNPGDFPTVTFSVTNPANGDSSYDLTEPEWTSGASSLNVLLAWDTRDYHNKDSGRAPSGAVSINALGAAANGDGTFSVTSAVAIPADVSGSGAVALEGHPAGDYDGDGTYSDRVPAKGEVDYFAITDSAPTPRRDIVDVAKCQDCHGERDGLSLHGNNRTDNVQLCVMCHNPNNTDLAARPTDPDLTDNEINTAAADGREERAIDFKQLIHSIHASSFRETPFVVYGFRNTPHDFSDTHFPGFVNDCQTCHLPDTYTLPLQAGVLATTIDTGATVNSSSPFGTQNFTPIGPAFDHSDDINIGPTAAACSSCHDGDLAQAHMEQNGGSFSALQSDYDNSLYTETCAVCHGSGRLGDVEVVHD